MFNKKNPQEELLEQGRTPMRAAETPRLESPPQAHIGSTLILEGEIKGEENLLVEGRVKGSLVFPNHRVTVGERGSVEGELRADVIEVYGRCKGEIIGGTQVTVYESGDVEGNISAPCVALQPGSRFKGAIDMGEAPLRSEKKKEKEKAKSSVNGSLGEGEEVVAPHVS